MYKWGSFQSVFQLAAALYVVAEWAALTRIEAHYQQRLRRELGYRLRMSSKYVEEFEGADLSDDEIAASFGIIDTFPLASRTRVLRVLISGGAAYSILMLLLSAFCADTAVPGALISLLVGLVFVPPLYFFLAIARSAKKQYASHKAMFEALIAPAEQATQEFHEHCFGPVFRHLWEAIKAGDRDGVMLYRKELQEIQGTRERFMKKRIAELADHPERETKDPA